jgi:predicted DNA-binding protein YlxM (UPF0122 family)
MPTKITTLNIDNIIELYNSGKSVNELSKIFNVARTVIYNRLKKSEVVIRMQKEANQLMMSKRTREENIKNTINAHNAIKGKHHTHKELCHRAISREKSFKRFVSFYESEIAKELSKRGIDYIPQKAVDIYNVDFCVFGNIALEVFGGGWHTSGKHKAKFFERSKKIFDSGYTIVICWITNNTYFIPTAIADYLVALNDILRSDPASRCKHYVIRGDGKTSAIGSKNLEYFS